MGSCSGQPRILPSYAIAPLPTRDLKLDNTLLDSHRPQRIKLCDFGFAKAWKPDNKNMFTHIGCVTRIPRMFGDRTAPERSRVQSFEIGYCLRKPGTIDNRMLPHFIGVCEWVSCALRTDNLSSGLRANRGERTGLRQLSH